MRNSCHSFDPEYSPTRGLQSSSIRSFQDELAHVEWCKLLATGLVELALELHPVQTQGVQETLQDIHPQEHAQCNTKPCREHEVNHDPVRWERHRQSHRQGLLEEDKRQLLVRKGQGPDTQVRCGVGDGAEHILNGLDDLVDENLTKLELLTMAVPTTMACACLLVGTH